MIIELFFIQATIPDPDDKKPEDWEKPETIPDPEATRPDDWDDEMVRNEISWFKFLWFSM